MNREERKLDIIIQVIKEELHYDYFPLSEEKREFVLRHMTELRGHLKGNGLDLHEIINSELERMEWTPISSTIKPSATKSSADKSITVTDKLFTITKKSDNEKGEKNNMLNVKSLLGEFGKVEGTEFKLSMQGVALSVDGENYAVYDADNNRMLNVMDFVAEAEGMFFKMPAQLNQLKTGDVVLIDGRPMIVKKADAAKKSIRLLDPRSNNESTHKPAGNLFGLEFITKVTTIFEAFGGESPFGGEQANPMNSFLMMSLLKDSDGSDSKLDKLLPLMMMQGGQNPFGATEAGAMNPLLMMSLLKDDSSDLLPLMMMQGGQGNPQIQQMLPLLLMKDGKNDMMETMMMMQMFGQGGNNPFAFMTQPAASEE